MWAIWIVNEIDQPIPVVDLYLQHPKHGKAQESRHLRTNSVAYMRGIKRHNVEVLLLKIGELESQFVGAKDILNRETRVRRQLCYLLGCRRINGIGERAGVYRE